MAITGDGIPRTFDLQFIDAEFGGVLGVIPVTIQTPLGGGAHLVELGPGEVIESINFGNRSLFLPGDTNRDGGVDFADFLSLSANFQSSDATWETGDFNGDGHVLFQDFLDLSVNFDRRILLPNAELQANAHGLALAKISETAIDEVLALVFAAFDEDPDGVGLSSP